MMDKYYIGKIEEDAKVAHKGWIMGTFLDDNDPRKSAEVEVKYWKFLTGDTSHPSKTSETVEFTMILEGAAEGIIGDEKIVLTAGDYVVIQPGVPNNLVQNITADITGLTVKAPSDPGAKKVIE